MITNNPKIEIWKDKYALIVDDTHFTPWAKEYGKIAFHHHISYYKDYIPHGGVVIDGGANQGMYSAAFCELVGDEGCVYSFEPNELPFVCLCINAPQAKKYKMALGEKDGFCDMSASKNYGSCHLQAGEAIPIRPLDFLKLDRCDLIKLDLEGHELFTLKGAIQTIQQFKPTLVLEVCPGNMARFNYQPADLYKYLDEINYKVIHKRGKEVLLDIVCVPK